MGENITGVQGRAVTIYLYKAFIMAGGNWSKMKHKVCLKGLHNMCINNYSSLQQ